jgi:DNA-directed RNA polymerase
VRLFLPPVNGTTAIQEGKRRYNAKGRRLSEKSQESKTVHGKYLYRHLSKQLNKAIGDFLDKATRGRAGIYHAEFLCLKELKTAVISHISMTNLLDTLTKPQKRTAVAFRIGQGLLDEIAFRRLKVNHKMWWKRLHSKILRRSAYKFRRALAIRAANQDFKDSWRIDIAAASAVPIGITLIELIRTSTGLVGYEKRKLGKNKTAYYLVPTQETIRWVGEFHRRVSRLSPYFSPVMEVPPKWVSVEKGGYDLPIDINWSFIKRNVGVNKERYPTESLKLAFSAANCLQEVPHRVSSKTLQAVLELQKRELLKDVHVQLSDERAPIGTEGYRASQALMYSRRRKLIPKLLTIHNILNRARSLKDHTIWFPTQADFRGRLYYVPKVYNPQGPDLARGLIEFAEPQSVRGSEHWFLIGGANRYGIKGTFQDRQDWVMKHEKEIKAVARDPIAHRSFWCDCDSPIEFLQWCMEFVNWIANRITFKTHLPVKLDHTASGLQIVALVRQDKELQRLTNLAGGSQPIDIYQLVLDSMKVKILATGSPELITWLSMGLDRKLIKLLTVMYMYGGTPHGLQKLVTEWYMERGNDVFGKSIYIEIRKLLVVYHEALNELSESPHSFMKECRKKVKKDETLSWTSPSGFPVSNTYLGSRVTRIRTTINGERISFHLAQPDGTLSYRRACNAVAANTVHSLDAALLHHVLHDFDKPVQALHDCYGVPPADVEYLQGKIKSSLGLIFGVDTAADLHYVVS